MQIFKSGVGKFKLTDIHTQKDNTHIHMFSVTHFLPHFLSMYTEARNYLFLIKICACSCVTIKQVAVIVRYVQSYFDSVSY